MILRTVSNPRATSWPSPPERGRKSAASPLDSCPLEGTRAKREGCATGIPQQLTLLG